MTHLILMLALWQQAAQPKPIACPKYTHPETTDCNTCDQKTHMCTLMNCISIPDHCADDMHVVTEKEWQELMSRLRRLENPSPSRTIGEQP